MRQNINHDDIYQGVTYIIGSMLDDYTVIHNINIIRLVKEVQTMRHKNSCPPGQRTREYAISDD